MAKILPTDRQSKEAGAVLNKKNKLTLKAALDAIKAALKSAGVSDDDDSDADVTEAAGFSIADLATLLQAELDKTLPAPDPERYNPGLRIVDIYDSYIIYCEGWRSVYYRRDFSVTDDGIVTLGAPSLVIRKVQYITPGASLSESGGLFDVPTLDGEPLALVESAIASDGTARIKLIDANRWGATGFYSADVLKRDGAKAFPAGTKMFIDHDTPEEQRQRPEGTITRLAAALESAAQFEDDPKHGAGLYAQVKVREQMRKDLDDIHKAIGTSIHASGKAQLGEAQGIKGLIITALTPSKFNRVDFVTIPGAGGKIVPLFESLRARQGDPADVLPAPSADPASDNDPATDPVIVIESEKDNNMTDEQIAAAISAGISAGLKEALAPINASVAQLQGSAQRQSAATLVGAHIGKIAGLPAATRAKIIEAASADVPLTEAGAIDQPALIQRADTIARQEARYLTEIGGAHIVGLGESASDTSGTDDAAALKETEAFNAEMTNIFSGWGLSEKAAKIAAQGRTRTTV